MHTRNIHRFLPLLFTLAAAYQTAASERTATFDGRAFFSAAERRALEAKPTALPASVAAPPPKRRYDGILWRDGRIVAMWFDGGPVDPATEPAIRIGGGIPVTMLPGWQQTLLPGQSWPPLGRKSEP